MKNIVRVALTLSALAITTAAHADTLNGTTVTGNLTFPASSTNLFTTGSTTVGSGTEFTGTPVAFNYSANFSDTGLLFSVGCTGTGRQCVASGAADYTATFTDSAFANGNFNIVGTTDIQDFSYTLSGDTLTIHGLVASGGSANLTFSPAAVAPTPEPSSIALLGTGLLGIAGVVRKRFRS